MHYAYPITRKNQNPNESKTNDKYRHGLAQAFCVKVYEDLFSKHKEVNGLWFIAGGYGTLGVGAHLYDEVVHTEVLQGNLELQQTAGLFLRFGKRGPEFLKAANRKLEADPELKIELVNDDEKEYVEAALEILKQSEEPDLAAKQVPSVVEKKEQVVPISVFTQQNKTPVTLVMEQEIRKGLGNTN